MTTSQHSEVKRTALSTANLRALAFALLAKKEYSRARLKEKLLSLGAEDEDVEHVLNELVAQNYQNDSRMAGMLVRSQTRQGKGPQRIKMALQKHQIEYELAEDELERIDWFSQALELKIKKFGDDVATDAKSKAKQIRFLQYRGFTMDIILKAIHYRNDE